MSVRFVGCPETRPCVRNVAYCGVRSWPCQWFALGKVDSPFSVTSNPQPALCRSTSGTVLQDYGESRTICHITSNRNCVFGEYYTSLKCYQAASFSWILEVTRLKAPASENLQAVCPENITACFRGSLGWSGSCIKTQMCFIYTHILLRHIWHCSISSLMKTYTQTNIKE